MGQEKNTAGVREKYTFAPCGVCLQFSWDQKREIEETLFQAYLQMEGIHCVD